MTRRLQNHATRSCRSYQSLPRGSLGEATVIEVPHGATCFAVLLLNQSHREHYAMPGDKAAIKFLQCFNSDTASSVERRVTSKSRVWLVDIRGDILNRQGWDSPELNLRPAALFDGH